ncbi:MAG: transporter substrate-binding domain-containing protein [Burkholderiaceae bacterium]|nr:transporter substrate-binding domain-containing protein [Burkholderiaceae bacterium]
MRHLMILAAWLFSAAVSAASPCEISLAYVEHPSAPYIEGEGMVAPAKPGIAVEIVNLAASQAACTVHLSRQANLRVLRSVEAGEFDGAILFSYEAERGALMDYPMKGDQADASRRLATLSYYLYRRKGGSINWDGTTLSNPDKVTIGINTGFSIADLLFRFDVKLDEVQTTEQNIGKLRLGRIGAYAMQEHIADPVIRQMHLENEIEKLPVPLSTKNYYLTFSHKFYAAHRETAEKIWSLIAEQRDGLTKSLMQHYQQ